MENTTQVKNFDLVNGLGTISFSPELITTIIKKVFKAYKDFAYVSHTITPINQSYNEVSICVKVLHKDISYKALDRLQKELLLVLKQSLSLTCVVIININNGK